MGFGWEQDKSVTLKVLDKHRAGLTVSRRAETCVTQGRAISNNSDNFCLGLFEELCWGFYNSAKRDVSPMGEQRQDETNSATQRDTGAKSDHT